MSELRKDPIVGRWVIIAPDRAKRPQSYKPDREEFETRFDPFAVGNESATPAEILAYREPGTQANGPGWRVRVVPNKFPALQVEGTLEKRGDGIYDMMNGIGAHEVIIECPHFETNMSRLSVDNIREVLWIYRDRLVDLKKDRRLVHGLIFKNKGMSAGATIAHTHSQLIVTSVVPISVWEEMTGSLEFFNYRGRCIYDDMIQQELSAGKRIVLDTPNFVVFCPYASRFPFETWILPKTHSSHYENIQCQGVDELGMVLKTVLSKLEAALDDPPYNFVIHTAPFDTSELPHYLWHIEIFPRLTRVAGFEWGSGFYINSVPPEEAATFLRDVELPTDRGHAIPSVFA
ncbi:MAG: galactose-1-phosphate uridylyltransferase [Planctomycetota bacterium]|nr:galactose-1-phosphate uridylyltransferase [Planctomycetota bacterium]MDA1213745.1 galactose-1-phosphate uridylyltransferase [Planctomycetota bacterium]